MFAIESKKHQEYHKTAMKIIKILDKMFVMFFAE